MVSGEETCSVAGVGAEELAIAGLVGEVKGLGESNSHSAVMVDNDFAIELRAVVLLENDVLEYGSQYHYMAMALADVGPAAWAADENSFDICSSVESDYDFVAFLDGSKWTEKMAWGCDRRGHSHPIAKACREFVPAGSTEDARNTDVSSDWFLPSAGQWVKAFTGLDSEHIKWNYNSGKFSESITGSTYDMLRSLFLNAGVGDCTPSGIYWTCTNRSEDTGCYIKLEKDKAITFSEEYEDNAIKTKQYKARPFILF